MTAHMNDMAVRNVKISTRKKYRLLFDLLSNWCREKGLIELRQLNVPALRDFRQSWKVAIPTANKRLFRLRAFMRFCERSEWIKKNPAAALDTAIDDDAIKTLPYTPEELDKIMRAADDNIKGLTGERLNWAKRLRALLLVLRWSGLRISDAVMLTPDRIEDDCIRLVQHKTKKLVRVPVPEEVLAALEDIGTLGNFYFGGRNGRVETRTGDWRRHLRRFFKKFEIQGAHAHRFRDTRAIELLMMGIPMDRVAAILGNTVTVCQKHYSPWVKERQDLMEEEIRKSFKKK